jgi:hypothetical protein
MTVIQKILTRLFPAQAAAIQAQSKRWMVTCPCGFARSVWAMGGVRYKAKGEPRKRAHCPACGQVTWHVIVWVPEPAEDHYT